MFQTNLYLNFPGNTEAAFDFYKSVFGGEFEMLSRFADTPAAAQIPESDQQKIMHVALKLGENLTLMGTDALESMGQKLTVGNNFSISLHPTTKADADKLYADLSQGGTATMPMQEMFWGAYYGMLTDKFGVQWMINCEEGK